MPPAKDAKTMTAFRKYLARLTEYFSSDTQIGYQSEYSISEHAGSDFVECKDVPKGLITWHIVSELGSESRVVCYWLSKDAFQRDEDTWRRQAGINSKLLRKGFIGSFKLKDNFFSKRSTVLKNTVLAIAGILAALTTIENFSDLIFSEPQITLKYKSGKIDVVEQENIESGATLVNQIQTTNKNLTIQAVLSPQTTATRSSTLPTSLELTVSEPVIPELMGGEKRELTITGKAPAHGKYKLMTIITTKAGWLRGTKTIREEDLVKVWPLAPATSFKIAAAPVSTRGILEGDIEIGPAPEFGLDCAIDIEKSGNFKALTFDPPAYGVGRKEAYNSIYGKELYHLSWSISSTKPMQDIHIKLYLAGENSTDWRVITNSTSFKCGYRNQGIAK